MKSKLFILHFGPMPGLPTGLAMSVLNRSFTFAKKGLDHEILVEIFDINFRKTLNTLRSSEKLHQKVLVRNLFHDLSGDSYSSNDLTIDHLEEFKKQGYIFVLDNDNQKIIRAYREGRYEMYVVLSDENKIHFIDYLETDFTRIKREYYDVNGILKKVIYMDKNNKPYREVYLNESGAAYLSILLIGGTNRPKSIVFFKEGKGIEFTSKQHLIKYWLSNYVLDGQRTIIISEYGFNFQVLQELEEEQNTSTIYTLHNNHFDYPHTVGSDIKPELKPFFNVLGRVKNLVVLTKEQKKDIMEQFQVNTNISVIPHAMKKVPKSIFDFVKTRDPQKVVMLGRFQKTKQFEHGIRAFEKVALKFPNATLEIYGRGDKEGEYIKLIESLGLTKHVFIKGFTENSLEVFKGAAISIVPSLFEGICLSLMESMSCGCIPIAYNFKYGPLDVIADRENGIIVECGNVEALSDAIIEVFSNSDLALKMSNGAKKITKNFSEERLYEEWTKLFERIELNDN